MKCLRAIWKRIAGMVGRRRQDAELAAELEAHLQFHIEDNVRAGMTPEEARRQALIKLGGIDQTKESVRDRRALPWLESVAQDIRFALRMMRKNPGFTVIAVLTLALGIGANTAIFSAVDEILFRPPNVAAPDRLAQIYSFNRKFSTYRSSSYPEYVDFRDQASSFQSLAAYARLVVTVASDGVAAERTSVECVSGNYFEMLGVPPVVGRSLGPADDAPGAAPAAMIGEDMWRTRFASDP